MIPIEAHKLESIILLLTNGTYRFKERENMIIELKIMLAQSEEFDFYKKMFKYIIASHNETWRDVNGVSYSIITETDDENKFIICLAMCKVGNNKTSKTEIIRKDTYTYKEGSIKDASNHEIYKFRCFCVISFLSYIAYNWSVSNSEKREDFKVTIKKPTINNIAKYQEYVNDMILDIKTFYNIPVKIDIE